jgi:hypothetical protein
MKANAMSLTFLATEGAVKIPFFQRGYVWDKSNWEDILNDLLVSSKSHFLGSLILKQQESQTGNPKEVLVIDGQQRLTTLSILLKALYYTFDDATKVNCEASINTHLFYKKRPTESTLHIKILHSRIDSTYYTKVIRDGLGEEELNKIIIGDDTTKTNSKDNKILQCFKYFVSQLRTKDPQERQDLFDRLLNTENKILVLIDLTDQEDEQAIFDTINSAGVRLSAADIIKNAIFQKALEVYESQDEVITLYKLNWENVFSKDDDTVNFWDTPRSTGRLMRDNIEILLHSISVIKGFFDPDKHTLSDLSVLYKQFISTLDKSRLNNFIEEIAKYARLYREKILAFDNSTLFSFSDENQRLFHILHICEISTFHPYLLFLFFKNENDDARLKQELFKFEKFIIRRVITKKETKSYNKTCKDFINKNSLIDSRIAEISDNEVLTGLENVTNKYASLLLFWIELKRRNDDSMQSLKELKYNYSLEHIMPQKWEEHWSSVPVIDINGVPIPNIEAARKERYSRIYSIGNMTLLNSSLNTSVRNYLMERKINGEGRKKGIRHYADLGITKNDILIPFDNGDKVWNEIKINRRTNALGNEILNIWN